MFYSATAKGFYSKAIHGVNIPPDAVEITATEYSDMLTGQSTGRQIVAGPGGKPMLAALVQPTLEDIRATKLKALAGYRFDRETGGVTVNGATVLTDRESQALITGAWVRVQQAPETTIDWKGDGGWIQVGKTAIEAISIVVGEHVQACFTNEKTHAVAIAALTTATAIESYDITTGWPQAVV